MKTTDKTLIQASAVRIARADGCRHVAPSHVVRAALLLGYGTPARPLTGPNGAIVGRYALGEPMTEQDAGEAVQAMLSERVLYLGHGGRFHYYDAPRAA